MRTPLCELLGIEHPVLLAPMAGVSGGALAAAVSALAEVGLQTTIDYQDGGNLARNTVFNQVPSPGFPAQNGTIVRLMVAGPAPGSTVPSLLGFPDRKSTRLNSITLIYLVCRLLLEKKKKKNKGEMKRSIETHRLSCVDHYLTGWM